MMKVIVDSAIPYIKGVLEPYAEVEYLRAGDISAESIRDADAMIIRTRTRCDRKLLEGSSVRFIATATAGTDHIDSEWCGMAGIRVCSAPGCNAGGVVQYVFTSLFYMAELHGIRLKRKRLGIVGAGNVGGRIAAMAPLFGFDVLVCDPPRAEREGRKGFSDFADIVSFSDIITFHVPLTESTRSMADAKFFQEIHKNSIFVNASRGEVVEEASLLSCRDRLSAVALDVWDNEPEIDRVLLGVSDLATPHIAGYSMAGKINATVAVVRAYASYAGIDGLSQFYPEEFMDRGVVMSHMGLKGKTQERIAQDLTDIYDVSKDSRALKDAPGDFEKLRTQYQYRKEFYV